MAPFVRAATAAVLALLAPAGRAEYFATLLEYSRAWGVVVADFDNDGRQDFFISGHDSDDRVWYWTPAGYRPSAQVLEWVDRHDCDAADTNRDGRMDMYCTVGAEHGNGIGPNELWLQDAAGVFQKVPGHGAEDPYGRGRLPVFLDFNHDGWPDIYVTNEATVRADGQPNHNHLFINQGGAGFVERITRATGANGYECLARGDVNGDGWDDLALCDGAHPARLYVNDRAGDFEEWHTPANDSAWKAVRLTDMNGDGLDDLVLVGARNRLQVWLNTGSGPHFDRPVLDAWLMVSGRSVTVGDFNQDGWRDIYVVLSKTDCPDTRVDNSPDLVFEGRSSSTWVRVTQPQDDYPGCGHLADTLEDRRVLLMNGGVSYRGPNLMLSWGFQRTRRLP